MSSNAIEILQLFVWKCRDQLIQPQSRQVRHHQIGAKHDPKLYRREPPELVWC
jgi:hypothetical protein